MSNINTATTILRLGPAALMVIFGLHQLYDSQMWTKYIPNWLPLSGMTPETFMKIHAFGNIFLGLLLASGLFPFWALILALIWWFSIVIAVFPIDWTIAVRDLVVASSLVALYMIEY